MKLALQPRIPAMIDEHIRSGRYATPEDVVGAALFALEEQLQSIHFAPGELEELLAEGERSIAEEGTFDGEESFRLRQERRSQKRADGQ